MLEVTPFVARRLGREQVALHGLLGVEHDLQLLPLDLDRLHRAPRLGERVGGDRGDSHAGIACLLLEPLGLARAERRAHSRQPERGRQVDSLHARVRVGGAQHRRLEHSGQLDVGREAGLAADALRPILPCRVATDDRLRPLGPLAQRILLDDEPQLLEAALDFLLGTDQSRQCRIASSIRG